MSVYHQMGHHSNNLVDLPEMATFRGAIYSPINADQTEVASQILGTREVNSAFESIFDPQLYIPATQRGKLSTWAYFPKDVDTANLSSLTWWKNINAKLAKAAQTVDANAVCSPIVIPKIFDNKFYANSVAICNALADLLATRRLDPIQTVLCGLADLSSDDRALEIASIVSSTHANRVYLIFVSDVEPRREISESDELLSAMRLIEAIESSGLRVLVGFCSSDLVLWKAAGASDCAAGKFFNLRRFTRERFEEPSGSGGGQLPYWFEENLMAFLREPDLIRVRKLDLLSAASLANPFCAEILAILDEADRKREKPKAWVGIGWRQFLYWFADIEARISRLETSAEEVLRISDSGWEKVENAKLLMDERHNNGSWVRRWLNIESA